jgi:CubicO group peptidase (beta-lactamase class C family)
MEASMSLILWTLVFGLLWRPLDAQIPVIGFPVSQLGALDNQMTQFMQANNISAGSLTVMRNGVIIFHHVYGWQDQQKQIVLRPDAIFRIASCTKPFTAAAIRKLIADGQHSLSSRVFALGAPGSGVLDHVPFGTPDSRLGDITVDHLLKHRGGWNRDTAGDLTYFEKTIATAMGVPSPPGRDNTVRYIMGQPLQHTPGSTYSYSNIGYLLLGLIIEKVSGQDFTTFVQQNVIGLDGSTTNDWGLARSFQIDGDLREPFYDDLTLATNVFHPSHSNVATVPRPYGSFDMEARTGQGRIATNGRVMTRFMNRFQVAGDLIGGPRPAPGGWRWNHTGSQYGANSLARQRGDGINYAVIFNKRPASGTEYSLTMRTNLDAFFDAGGITWPTADVTQLSPSVPAVSLTLQPPTLTCTTQPGRHYQCQRSSDLAFWEDHRPPFLGTGSNISITPAASGTSCFYRFVVRQ